MSAFQLHVRLEAFRPMSSRHCVRFWAAADRLAPAQSECREAADGDEMDEVRSLLLTFSFDSSGSFGNTIVRFLRHNTCQRSLGNLGLPTYPSHPTRSLSRLGINDTTVSKRQTQRPQVIEIIHELDDRCTTSRQARVRGAFLRGRYAAAMQTEQPGGHLLHDPFATPHEKKRKYHTNRLTLCSTALLHCHCRPFLRARRLPWVHDRPAYCALSRRCRWLATQLKYKANSKVGHVIEAVSCTLSLATLLGT